jgi:hypothetical protein
LDRADGESGGQVDAVGEWDWQRILLRYEDGVGVALETREDVRTKVLWGSAILSACREQAAYIDRADEVFVAGHDICKGDAENDGEEPCTKESFPRLLGRDFNQRRAAEGDATNVGKYIVCNDHGHGQKEPDHALENVIYDEVGLTDDQE